MHRHLCLAAVLPLAGCCSPRPAPPLQPLPVAVERACFAGAPLAGPQPEVAAAGDGGLLRLRWTLLALAAMPDALGPLAQHAQLLLQPESPAPLRSVAATSAAVRYAAGAAAQELCAHLATAPATAALPLGRGGAVLARGLTTSLGVVDDAAPRMDHGALLAPLGDGSVQLLFTAADPHAVEWLQLPPLAPADGPFAFAWPRPQQDRPAAVLLLTLALEPSTDADDAAALATARSEAEAQRAAAAAAGVPPTQQFLQQQRLRQALRALPSPQGRRPALLQLCDATTAPLAADLALVGEDELLQALVAALGEPAALAPLAAEALQLTFERAAWRALLPRLEAGDLPPALVGLLHAHAGAAGSDPAALAGIVDGAADAAALQLRLVQENLTFLYEDDPARRVAAFDWLAARGRAPAGYDPLAGRRERRAALRAHAARAEAGR